MRPEPGSWYPVEEMAASSANSEPNVKGVAFRSVLTVLGELHGDAIVQKVYEDLGPEHGETLRYRVVQTGWYPISLYRALWASILKCTGNDYEVVRRIGAGAIRRDVTGVYRVIFKVLSPETVLGLSGKLFGNYYDTGTLTVVDKHHGSARAVYEGCKGFDRAMWDELIGSALELIAIGGGKNVRAKQEKGGGTTQGCVVLIEWD